MSMYPIQICSLIIFELVLLMGLALNMFIITVISRDWYHSQCLPPCDLILLSEALTNIAIQIYSSLEYLFRIVWTEIYILEGFQKFLYITYPLIVFSNFWITAWHCVFYCLKIANFSHTVFLRLKHMISDLVPWLILGTVVAALAVSFPIIWLLKEQYPKNSTKSALIMGGGIYSYNYFYVILMDSIAFSLPLGMIVTSAVMILASLYKHAQRMQQNATSFSRPSLEAHKGAAKIILSLLALYTCFYLALITAMADENGHRETPMFYVYKYIITLYPLMHALVILKGNPKLKAMATKTLWCCWY